MAARKWKPRNAPDLRNTEVIFIATRARGSNKGVQRLGTRTGWAEKTVHRKVHRKRKNVERGHGGEDGVYVCDVYVRYLEQRARSEPAPPNLFGPILPEDAGQGFRLTTSVAA